MATLATDTSSALPPIDVAALLAPIPGDHPAGEDLRHSAEVDALNDARRMDDDTDKGIWQTNEKKADWKQVVSLGSELLTHRSKDLQIAAWVTQALRILQGPSGLATGLDLLRGLVETFWDDLYPRIDGDDLEARLGPILWLNEHLSRDLLTTVVVHPTGVEKHEHTLQDWQSAQRLQKLATRDSRTFREAVDDGAVTVEQIHQARDRTPTAFYRELRRDLRAARTAADALGLALDRLAGIESPSLRRLTDTLDELTQFAEDSLRQRGAEVEEAPPPPPPVDPVLGPDGAVGLMTAAAAMMVPAGPPGAPRSREEAYAMLHLIADFLAREEPHSPTSYLVRRAASWGRLTLPELYAELLGDRGEIGRLFSVLRLGEE